MTSLLVTVPGRALTERKRQNRLPNGAMGKRTDTSDRADYKAWVKLCVQQAMAGRQPWEKGVPLALAITVTRARPASMRKCDWAAVTKPDADNHVKLVADCLNGLVWHDDAQVVSLHVTKRVAENGEAEELRIAVREATPEDVRRAVLNEMGPIPEGGFSDSDPTALW